MIRMLVRGSSETGDLKVERMLKGRDHSKLYILEDGLIVIQWF
jgi:hypothetical protein